MSDILSLKSVAKTFPLPRGELEILHDVNMTLKQGELVALLGTSGSGKTTLLQLVGLLSEATSGEIVFQGENATNVSEKQRTYWRKEHIGFVYQFHYLLPEFTAQENVALPHIAAGVSKHVAMNKAANLLSELDMMHRAEHLPSALSGGEQQRVSLARALVNDPVLLIADEPTGNLDDTTSEKVFQLLIEAVKQRQMAALIATHNTDLATRMNRILRLEGGGIVNI